MAKARGPTWRPRASDFQQVIAEQNPWHSTGQVPDAWAHRVERPLARALWKRVLDDEPHRFQLILGPRRVGKTTSMYQTVRRLLRVPLEPARLWWLRLDHPILMQVDLGQLVKFVIKASNAKPDKPVFLLLDELAYGQEWDLWLKTFYDETLPVRIAGTSSSTAALRDRRLESGVGRWEEQYLAPYLFLEYLELLDRRIDVPVERTLSDTIDACIGKGPGTWGTGLGDARRRFLLTGGFPELLIQLSKPEDEPTALLQSQRTLRNDAVERAIYKDIPQAFGVHDPMLLERLLYTLAGRVTGILSPSKICQTLGGMTQPTFDKYLSYLERAFLVFTLPNYSGSEASVQRRGRKLYFVDGAVRNAALQRGLAPLSDPGEMGLLIENLAAGHLHALSQQTQIRLYHWHDGDDEVDLIYDQPDAPLAFEIGSSRAHHRRGLHAFVARFPRFKNRCFLIAPELAAVRPADTEDGLGQLPLDVFLLAVSALAERRLADRLSTGVLSATASHKKNRR